MKIIRCSNKPECDWIFARLYDEGTIELVRKDQRFTLTGKDFNILGTCKRCRSNTALVVKNGKLIIDKDVRSEDYVEKETPNAVVPEPVGTTTVGEDSAKRSFTAK